MDLDDIRSFVNELLEDLDSIKSNNKRVYKRKINNKSIKKSLSIENNDYKNIDKTSEKYWILKLNDSKENRSKKQMAIRSTCLKIYSKLAISLEDELIKYNSSLEKVNKQMHLQNDRRSVYKILYNISEIAIISKYDRDFNYYSINPLIDVFRRYTNKQLSEFIRDQVSILVEEFYYIDDSIKTVFNITDNNRNVVFWDKTGKKRDEYNFSNKELMAINLLSKRNNSIVNLEESFDLIIDLFLQTLT